MIRRCGIVAIIFLTGTAFAALPPPQGKSMRADGQYDVDEKPLPIWDVMGRLESRSKILEAEKPKVPDESVATTSAAEKRKNGLPTKKRIGRKISESDAIRRSASVPIEVQTNLPGYYQGIERLGMRATDQVMFVPKNAAVHLNSVKSGDVFHAVVEQKIKASATVATPIRAMIISGALKGGFFVGEATLDRELKRVLLTFTKVRSQSGSVYALKASGLSPEGSIGLEGEYHSQSGTFFVAELASATAGGILSATINQNQTSFGTYVQEPSLANTAKTGAVTAMAKSAERFAQDARQAPEYTELAGYQAIEVIVQGDPTELN